MAPRTEWSAQARFTAGAAGGLVIGLLAVLSGFTLIPALALIPLSMLVFGLLGVALGKLLLGALLP